MVKDQYKYFRIEARELLEGLNQVVLDLERGERGKDLVGRLLRFAHTLEGASRVVRSFRFIGMVSKWDGSPSPFHSPSLSC
jgi:two-component system, chemotaxis family, sensor kinase CheA